MKKHCLALVIFILFLGCTKSSQDNFIYVSEFPKERKIKGEAVEIKNTFDIIDISIIDTFLIIINETENSYIQLYSTISNNKLGEYSNKGRGPGEFIAPQIIKQTKSKTHNYLSIFDAANKNITNIDLLESIKGNTFTYFNETLNSELDKKEINEVFYISANVVCFEEEGVRVSLFRKDVNSLTQIPYCYPTPDFPIQKTHEYFIYKSDVRINPGLQRIVAAPFLIGQIDFFDYTGNHISTTVFYNDKSIKKDMNELYRSGSSDMKMFIGDIKHNDKYIYALNYNFYENLYYKNKKAIPNNEIMVFDWDGSPVEKLILDRFAALIAIDFKNNKLFAYCPFETEHTIVQYELSE